MNVIFAVFMFLFSSLVLADSVLIGKKFLCEKLLWGFEFISSDKVNVINTDINNITYLNEYYYERDSELPYVNIFLIQKNIRDVVFSINNDTFRVDVWTMTSGGNTTREIIPEGFCKDIKTDNLLAYIEGLK